MNTRNLESEQAKARRPSLLDEVLERRMLVYALAAGAALAGASAAQAKVVFTPSNAVVRCCSGALYIDLNNDGVVDFSLFDYEVTTLGTVYAMALFGSQKQNRVEEYPDGRFFLPALTRGTRIGAGVKFKSWGGLAQRGAFSGGQGYFPNTSRRSLGVKFTVNGQVHYGWIGFRNFDNSLNATLFGWAYETEPNKPIQAGDTSENGSDSAALPSAEPTSLQLLATGHVAIADRQRRITAQAGS